MIDFLKMFKNLLLRNHKGDEAETWHTCLGHWLLYKLCFLAHLSQRLKGELIVYEGIRRPSVRRPSVCQHFQTTSPLKP